VLLEDQAVAEFFAQRLFGGNGGLLAHRQPIISNAGAGYRSSSDETLDDRIGRRILSRDLSIKAMPSLKKFNGIKLLGSYEVDAEGVRPPSELVLVENGMLKTLLSNRTPTRKVRSSNGHERPVISGYSTTKMLGPSVIRVSTSEGKSGEQLKRELIERARGEGLDYGLLVRSLHPQFIGSGSLSWMGLTTGKRGSSSLTRPLLVYRVYVEDGHEELIRSVQLDDISISTLRHILGVAEKQFVYNTQATIQWRSGIPASFIVPEAILLEELDIKKEQRGYTPKLPIVPSPLTQR
jgi:hypothetical protein